MVSLGRIIRILIVGGMYLVALHAAGVGFLKTIIAITIIMVAIMISRLGRPWIQQLGVAGFVLVLLDWSGIAPVERWFHNAFMIIDKLLA